MGPESLNFLSAMTSLEKEGEEEKEKEEEMDKMKEEEEDKAKEEDKLKDKEEDKVEKKEKEKEEDKEAKMKEEDKVKDKEKEKEEEKKDKVKEEEAVSDLQLSFVSGNSFVRPQTSIITAQEPHEHYTAENLCLSRTNLQHITDSILKNSKLKCLYLEGNGITTVPVSVFVSLPDLLWLDLRNNQIEKLPAEIGSHRCLKTLLLEGNPISELPAELGKVITLRGLNLRDCPITFPPQDIVQWGVQSILRYLRTALAARPLNASQTPPELPVVEKLHLSELTESRMEDPDECVDEDELQKFRELKHKIVLLDKAELESTAHTKTCPPAVDSKVLLSLTSSPTEKEEKATTKASIIPELPLFDTRHWKRPEEKRQAEMKELKEKQAALEHRRTSHQRPPTKQGKPKKQEKKRNQEEPNTKSSSSVTGVFFREAESRSAHDLERQLRARAETVQERRGGSSSEQKAAAEQDVEEIRRLQNRLMETKMNRERKLERSSTVFTADSWQRFMNS